MCTPDSDGNDREIYLIKANGGGRRQLTDNTTFDSDPAWSPSGKRIVYYTMTAPTTRSTRSRPTAVGDGSSPTTPPTTTTPLTTVRRKHRECVSDATQSDIFTMNANGGNRHRRHDSTADEGTPNYSPGGKWITYAGDDGTDYEIYAIKVNGAGRHRVTDNTLDDFGPSWSPSGKRIAYYGDDGNDTEIYTISPDGGSRRQLTDNTVNDYDAGVGRRSLSD